MRVLLGERLACALALVVLGMDVGCGDNIAARRAPGPSDGGPHDGATDAADTSPLVDGNDGETDGRVMDLADADDGDSADGPSDGTSSFDGAAGSDGAAAGSDGSAAGSDGSGGSAGSDAGTADAPSVEASGDAPLSDGADGPMVPDCAITSPNLTVMHPMLNGVSTAEGGDRASADNVPYQVTFEVTSSIADNQNVELTIDNLAAPTQTTVYTA